MCFVLMFLQPSNTYVLQQLRKAPPSNKQKTKSEKVYFLIQFSFIIELLR